MSLRIIYGRAGTGKSTFCLNEIKNVSNQKVYIITPEQFSYSMEKRLLKNSERKVTLNAEVLSFKRLADRIFTEVGGANDVVISKSGQAMIIYSILQDQKEELKFLGKTKENIDLILKEITELKKHNITVKRIQENIYNITEINLQGKLQDISRIYEEYEKHIENKYIDEDDILTKMSKKIQDSKMFDKSIVFFDEFSGFTMQEYSIIEEILQKAEQVNVTICSDNLKQENTPETDIFYSNKNFANKIINIAEKLDLKIDEPVYLEENRRIKNNELLHLEKNIYDINPNKYEKNVKNIKIKLMNDTYSEIENIAIEIIKLIKNEKLQYRDISVISNNIEEIDNIVKAIFNRYEIPYFIDEKSEITENFIIKFIISIMEIFSKNWSQEAVFNYIKSGILDLKKEEIYTLENYCIKNGIKGNKWYKNKWNELEAVQEKVVNPLMNLKKNLEKEKTAKKISKEIYNFLIQNNIQEKFQEKIEKLQEEKETARIYKESLDILVDVLDEIAIFFGDEKLSFDKYKEILKIGLKNKEVGKIPQFMDQVIIGDIDRTRTHRVKAIFIVGMNDGNFPIVNKNEGFFDDNDRGILKLNNLEIAKNTIENLYEDQFNIYKAFTIAEDKIYISYNSTNKEGTSLRPSILISKIKNIFPKLKEESEVLEEKKEIINVNATFNELLVKMRAKSNNEEIEDVWYDVYNWYNSKDIWREKLQKNMKALEYTNNAENIKKENIMKLYGNTLKTSISKMEQYRKCPFSFHLKYGLKLQNAEEYKLKSIDTGNFMHEILDEFFSKIDNIDKITPNEIETIVKEIINQKLKLDKNIIFTSSPKFIVLTNKLKNTIIQSVKYIIYQIQNSDFKPVNNELEFNKKIDNIEISGKIDRVDIAKDKFIRIIDYKSSEKNIDLNQMMAGTQIQLLTYIDALSEQKRKEPAGILYFNLIEPIINENRNLNEEEIEQKIRKSFKMKGLILADVHVIKMMDNELEKGSSNNIPVYLDKDGNISKSRSNIVTEEQFKDLQRTIKKIIKKISQEILNGKIDIKPMYDTKNKLSTCKFCEYKNICRFNSEENEYQYLQNKSRDEILNEIKERKE